jgi:Fe(II)/alpha-ketoglutarate-dependent arginine beta-hydroxylase
VEDPAVFTITLTEDDRRRIDAVLDRAAARYPSAEDQALSDELSLYAHELPRSLRGPLNEFRLHEPSGVCVVSGFAVDDERIGETPTGWHSSPGEGGGTLREDLFLLLCAALLGDPIAWATQQDGRLLHDVVPIKGHEYEQINSSTAAPLWWHTEDAFHPSRADYVGLLCLRNPEGAETTYANFDDLRLDPETVRLLSEPWYTIRPDESHLAKNRAADSGLGACTELLERSYLWVQRMAEEPPPIPILFGDPGAPYGRLDPYFMDRPEDERAAAAFDALVKEIDDKLSGVVLRPGDLLFVDNYKAVHGRKPYTAAFTGRDRWLRRVNVSRDLRKSREARTGPAARVVF